MLSLSLEAIYAFIHILCFNTIPLKQKYEEGTVFISLLGGLPEIIEQEKNGFLAGSKDEFLHYSLYIINAPENRTDSYHRPDNSK